MSRRELSPLGEQLLALAGVFEAAAQVEQVARHGRSDPVATECLLGSLLVRNPDNTLDVFGGNLHNLSNGLRVLNGTLEREMATLPREILRYALTLITLERQLNKRGDLLELLARRLDHVEQQRQLFGITHDNVIASCASIYLDTISTFRQRIQVQGEMSYLRQANNAARIRALLLAGVRCARLWHQLGGRRWHLLLKRKRLLQALQELQRDSH